MYAVRITQRDFVAGTEITKICRARFKTEAGARKRAAALSYSCAPDGKTKVSEVIADVIRLEN
ncbi:hypothetical protein [Methylocaldum szegediense]|uniref:Uncharacterized protein n=1 Tax=Methylocaldum szegediense TaxID=73780 RepID=A0ABM9I991_9GAMM|nr:hypothetical protein [Methylocaldum szegediense]CAI8970871.1 conserved protein of unknown function [Methylocaldum szegediense]